MPIWAIILIVVIVIIAIMFTCISFSNSDECISVEKTEGRGFNRTLSYKGSIPCYLCLSKVSNSSWDSGEHRKRCAYNNQRELLSYPQPYESFCPNCHERLSLWPAKGHPFYCDQCPFDQRSVLKRSTGENRLNCFLCDFDCCVNCANEGKMQRRLSLENIESGGFRRTLSYKQPNTEQAGTSDDDIERLASALAVEKFIDPESNPTPPYNPYHTDTTTTSSTPFIIPQQSSTPAYPAPEYHAYINRTSYRPPVTCTIQPLTPIHAPPDLPSLPYAIQPIQQNQATESSTLWAPSAPPLINKY
eukprot:GFUD01000520.1.p1 GENE.GFUD01000520.1~~GFUD01000520.1.p1  ORF type:complete len:303 (+),score=25.50 GFUD01000520.1:250-1158(+)